MKRFACAYRQALGLFAFTEVSFDALKSCLTIIREGVYIAASVLWVVATPFLAFVEMGFPGSLDRLLFRLAR